MTEKQTTIGNALFTKTQQQLLRLLFGNPDRSFYTKEIVRLANVGSGSVQRELARLSAAGLLTVTQLGNQKHYQANPGCPIFEELRGIVVKTFGVADLLKQALAPYAARIEAAFIYGSIAKGKEGVNSDVDVMLIGEGLSYAELMGSLSVVEEQLGRPVNPSLYSPTEFKRKLSEGNAFLQRVLQQPKIELMGALDDFGKSQQSGEDQAT